MRWALDDSLSEDTQKAKMGRSVLDALSRMPLSKDDREILRAATQRGFGRLGVLNCYSVEKFMGD